jgi:hypothetical protein
MIWSYNCLGIIDHQSQPTTAAPLQHKSAYPRQCYASCCCLLFKWVIVPYPTDLTSPTVAIVSHHDDGDSEHYRSCWRILIRLIASELWFGTPTTFQSLFLGARQVFWSQSHRQK